MLNLWRNEKSREIIIQVIVLLLLGWSIAWLAGNVAGNFERLGKDLSYEFLGIPAGYFLLNIPEHKKIPSGVPDSKLSDFYAFGGTGPRNLVVVGCTTARAGRSRSLQK